MINEDNEDEDVIIETSPIVNEFLTRLKMIEEWADTEWLPTDFKD